MRRAAILIILPALLGACTTMYPPLYSAPTIASKAPAENPLTVTCKSPADPLKQTIACAQLLQDVYSKGYVESARWQDITQLPIIGAAGAAAWILLKDKANAARKVGKIGIATGVYAAGRGQLLPTDMPEYFIKGHGALGCVLAEEPYFDGSTADEAFASLNSALRRTGLFAGATARLRYIEPSDPAAAPDLLKSARALADQAVGTANTQLRASRQERAAFQFAASPFRQSVSDIAGWVASKGRTRPNTSYDDLLKGMSSSPPASGGTAALNGGANDAVHTMLRVSESPAPIKTADLVANIALASQTLSEATIELAGSTPPYAARLTKVSKCATDLPAG